MSQVSLLTPPAFEPVLLTEAKAHLRVEHAREDDLILDLIRAARALCEQVTRRALIEQRRELRLDRPPSLFHMHRMVPLPYPPLIAVETVAALGVAEGETALAPEDYEAIAGGEGIGRVSFHTVPFAPGGLSIRYRCGYGPMPDDVPAPLRQGMLMAIAHWYEHREDVAPMTMSKVPFATEALWRPYRVVSL